ncbi:TetR/AcrR family transcriptional regulator [Actinoallomurus acaciae]|uniref:TetR/AcrR family transcriptional regulator n=1 Tax=Actinoallomurus acaciae TaxID=502577 RepID=A0ABV5YHD7_9ACTN
MRAELLQLGYAGLTIDGVAKRAHTSTPVLYRRWPSKAVLVLDALSRRGVPDEEPPDSGDLREDLLAFLQPLARRFDGVLGEAMRGLLAETGRDPELAALVQAQIARIVPESGITAILNRALSRGQIRGERLRPRAVALPTDLLRHEVIARGTPIPPTAVAEIVDDVIMPLLACDTGYGRGQDAGE